MKSNLFFKILYIIAVVSTFRVLEIVLHPWCWKCLQFCCPLCGCNSRQGFILFYMVVTLASVIFSLILKGKKIMVVPVFMLMLIFSFCLLDVVLTVKRYGAPLSKCFDKKCIFNYFKVSFPAFIGSSIGVFVSKLISSICLKFKNKLI